MIRRLKFAFGFLLLALGACPMPMPPGPIYDPPPIPVPPTPPPGPAPQPTPIPVPPPPPGPIVGPVEPAQVDALRADIASGQVHSFVYVRDAFGFAPYQDRTQPSGERHYVASWHLTDGTNAHVHFTTDKTQALSVNER